MKKIHDDLNKERAKIAATEAWWDEHGARLEPAALALDELGADVELCVSMDPDVTVRLAGDAHKLAAAVRAMRTRGFSTDESAPTKGQTSWAAWFRYEGARNAAIYFSFSSTVCRRVQVGTKLVPAHEEPIYETVCGEVDGELQPIAPQPTTPAPVGDIPL